MFAAFRDSYRLWLVDSEANVQAGEFQLNTEQCLAQCLMVVLNGGFVALNFENC